MKLSIALIVSPMVPYCRTSPTSIIVRGDNQQLTTHLQFPNEPIELHILRRTGPKRLCAVAAAETLQSVASTLGMFSI